MQNRPDIAAIAVPQPPMLPRMYRIQRVRKETHDCFSLTFEIPASERFQFAPGQFNMLYVFGVGEAPISISSAPASRESLTHTIRTVGVVTQALSKLKKGDEVGIRGPFGRGWPTEEIEGRDIIFIAGGIGLSPLRPAIYDTLAHRHRYDKISVVYGTRTPDDILHEKDLGKWSARLDTDVQVTVDSSAGHWHGQVGVVTQLITKTRFDPANACALICGPEIMMRFSVTQLLDLGVSEERIFMSMERNMKCALGFCGHCQYGPHFVCRDGPVFRYPELKYLLRKAEI